MLLFRFTLFCLPLLALAGRKHYRKDGSKASKSPMKTSNLLIFPNPLQFFEDLEKSPDMKITDIRGSAEYKEYIKTLRDYLANKAEQELENKQGKRKVIYKTPEKRPVFHIVEETLQDQDDSKELKEKEEPTKTKNDDKNDDEAQDQDQDQEASSEEEQDDQPEELYPEENENENEYSYQDQSENEYPYHIEDQQEDDVEVYLKKDSKIPGGWGVAAPSTEPGFLSQLLGKIKGIVPKLHSVEFPSFQLAIAKPEEMAGWGGPPAKERPPNPDEVIHEYQFGGGTGSLSKDENGVSFSFTKGKHPAPKPKPPKGKGGWGKTFLAVFD